jgi:hypothetical protein
LNLLNLFDRLHYYPAMPTRLLLMSAALAILGFPALAMTQSASPSSQAPDAASFAPDSRVFELRTYHANAGKLGALNKRFRDHTVGLFKRHGMDVIAFWMPVTEPADASPGGTLVYVLAYPSMEAREAAWKAFSADPEWVSVKDASERDGKLVAKVDSLFMKATDYSAIK